MKLNEGKIVEVTENELFNYWMKSGWENLYSFSDYMRICEEQGTKIIKED